MPFGLFEFVRMPFGLKMQPSHFSDSWMKWYNLRQLFEALRKFGLVINRSKCVFGTRELDFLGHRVSSAGVRPLPEKVRAVKDYQVPQLVKSLQRFLGMLNFYRRFLPNISAVLRPLTDALAGSPNQLIWTSPMTSAFEEAKKRLARAMLLVHPRSGVELRLRTDASERAIASAVHQVIDGQEQPLAFFSRRITSAESRYSAYDLELLAIYAPIQHFRHFLEGRRFKIFTDQRPLTSAFLKAQEPVSNRQKHQLAVISEFCTEIAHVPGIDNVVTDAMSRQHDNEVEGRSTFVHAVAHFLPDVDLDELAADQSPNPDTENRTSLNLQHIQMPGCSIKIWCDTSQLRPRFLVLQGCTVKKRLVNNCKLRIPSGTFTYCPQVLVKVTNHKH